MTITLATWAGAEESNELQAVIDKVNAEATDFEIVHQANPADYYTKMQTMIAGNTAPDLMWLSQEYVANYRRQRRHPGYHRSGGSVERHARRRTGRLLSRLLARRPIQRQAVRPALDRQPVMLYYNPELFEAAGVDPPDESWTWDTFKEAAKKLTVKDASGNITQYGTAFNGWPPVHMFIWQAGGEVISRDLQSSPIDSPEAIEGAQFYADIIYNPEYAVPEEVIKEQGFGEMAKAGKVAMFFGGAADDLDYAHAERPSERRDEDGPGAQGTEGPYHLRLDRHYGCLRQTENPDLAVKAMVALTEGIHHWKVLAPRKSLATAEVIAAACPARKNRPPVHHAGRRVHALVQHHPQACGMGYDLLGAVPGPAVPRERHCGRPGHGRTPQAGRTTSVIVRYCEICRGEASSPLLLAYRFGGLLWLILVHGFKTIA